MITIKGLESAAETDPAYLSRIALKEIKNRLAQQILRVEGFPFGLSKMSSIEQVLQEYINSFESIREAKPSDQENLSQLFEEMLKRHENTAISVARGLFEW
jgi:hypothetical protein